MRTLLESQGAQKVIRAARLETEKRKRAREAESKATEEAERTLRTVGTLIDRTA